MNNHLQCRTMRIPGGINWALIGACVALAIAGGAAEKDAPGPAPEVSVSLDQSMEGVTKWSCYDVLAKEDFTKYISVQGQTEKLHGTERGLLFTFRNLIAETKDGETKDDICLIATRGNLNGPFLEADKYTRFTAWAYVTGARHPLLSLIMYFRDPKNPNGRPIVVEARTPVVPNTWNRLVVTFDHLSPDVRRGLTRAGVFRIYMRPEPDDDKESMRLYLDDFRLEGGAERKCRGSDADPTVVIVNQVGYRPTDRKLGIVNGANPAVGFCVRKSEGGTVVYEGPLDLRPYHWGAFKLADFSSFHVPGRYFVEAGKVRSVDFDIKEDVYTELMGHFIYAIRNMRCGSATDQRAACHLDNAQRLDTGKHADLVGGYHDAGDTRHYNHNSILALNAAVTAARVARAMGAADKEYIDEARWAALHIEKLIAEFGPAHLPERIENLKDGSNRHNNYWTDNIPGNADDHVVDGNRSPIYPNEYHDAILGLAILADLVGIETKDGKHYLDLAGQIWKAHEKVPDDQFSTAFACLADIELHHLTGREEYATRAKGLGQILLSMQERRFLLGSSPPVAGYFRTYPTYGLRHYQKMHHGDIAVRALARLIEAFPDAPEAVEWRAALLFYAELFVKPLLRLEQPYGIAVTALADQEEVLTALAKGYPSCTYVPLGIAPDKRIFHAGFEGSNSSRFGYEILITGWTRLFLARTLSDLDLQEAARRNLGFALGENPFIGMIVAELGQDPLYSYYCLYGRTPGVLAPCSVGFDFFTRHSSASGSKEVFLPPTCAALFLAASLAEPFVLAGKVISNGKPTSGELTLSLPGDDTFTRKFAADTDGAFGPIQIAPGAAYELRIGPIVRQIVAVSGGRAALTLAVDGEARLSPAGARYAPAPLFPVKDPKKLLNVLDQAPGTPLQAYAGQDIILKITLTPQGKPPATGRLLLSGVNVAFTNAVIEYKLETDKPTLAEIVCRAVKSGAAFAVHAVVESQPDTVLDWVGVAHEPPR